MSNREQSSQNVADPARLLAEIESCATRLETPCGQGTMVWRIWGDSGLPPLVLAHGAQGSWNHWVRNIDRLSRQRRLIVPDLPGHGESAMPASEDHAVISQALAEGLEIILGRDALPLDLCGFSFGGVVLAHLAAIHPQVARRLVLVGCGGLGTRANHPRLSRISGLMGEERRAALKGNLLGLMLHHAESADDLAIHMLLPTAKASRINAQPLVMPDKLLRILPKIECQIDAIWGELDWPHPDPEAQEQVLRSIRPELDFCVIANSGHWVMYEQPEAFEAALTGMLNSPLRQ